MRYERRMSPEQMQLRLESAFPQSEVVVRDTGNALLLFHLSADGALVGASGVGRAVGRDIRIAQMLIGRNARVSAGELADPSVKLKTLLVAETA